MKQAQAILEERGIAAESLPAMGEPATAIARLAEEHDVDLVVVGTRELGALQRLLGQSVSQAVSRWVRCDLLIVHPGDLGRGGAATLRWWACGEDTPRRGSALAQRACCL